MATNKIVVIDSAHDKEKELQALEAKVGWRQLCNIEVLNKYAAHADVCIGQSCVGRLRGSQEAELSEES